jgi:hypothetical protein
MTGSNPTIVIKNCEEYDGSSWAEVNDVNTARGYTWGMGTQAVALLAGGDAGAPPQPSTHGKTETYDGTSFTEAATLGTPRGDEGGGGTGTDGFIAGGNLFPGTANETEEWADPVIAAKTLTTS